MFEDEELKVTVSMELNGKTLFQSIRVKANVLLNTNILTKNLLNKMKEKYEEITG